MQICGRTVLTVLVTLTSMVSTDMCSADLYTIKPGEGIFCLSPDGNLRVKLDVDDGATYTVRRRTCDNSWEELIRPSALGVVMENGPAKGKSTTFSSEGCIGRQQRNWKPVFGKTSSPGCAYREVDLEFGLQGQVLMEAVFRVFNDGVALRYVFYKPKRKDLKMTDEVTVTSDLTEFRFARDCRAWSYNGEHQPKGPMKLSEANGRLRMPVTLQASDHCYMALLEGAIYDWDVVDLAPIEGDPRGLTVAMDPSTVSLKGPGGYTGTRFATPWHVIQITSSPGKLLESNILVNLNPRCQIEDASWIEPGLAMWDWRAWGAKTDDGFTYGLDMPSWRRFIDFASEYNIRYLILDAGWYGLEFNKESDPRTSRDYLLVQPDPQNPRLVPRPAPDNWKDPIDIPKLIRYGNSKNVGIILYFNDIARANFPFEETLALYQQWGAAGIKYGFMKGSGQSKVRKTRNIIELCAKHQLLCNFHDGPVPPSGDRRTYPNCVTREFCHSQSDARRAFSPTGFCEQVFVNMLAGPLDMCNGLYTLKNPAEKRPKIFTNVNTTIAAETARVMIIFSGVSILPDCPEAYKARADLFDFLGKLPMTWDETRILHGRIGQYIATARRHGKRWFIASATNEQSRTLPLKLDFLKSDTLYTATLYEDAPETHYINNREAYRVRHIEVKKGDTIDAWMAPGGGHSVYLEPETKNRTKTHRF